MPEPRLAAAGQEALLARLAEMPGYLEAAFAALGPERRGRQEGVGAVALRDIPAMMAAHDAGHRGEIEAWKRERSAERG